MAYVDSPAGQVLGVIPDANEDPAIPYDLLQIVTKIERRLFGIYLNGSDRDAKLLSPEQGMMAYLKGSSAVTQYNGTAWVAWPPAQPAITSGSTVPPNSSGANGDIFFQV